MLFNRLFKQKQKKKRIAVIANCQGMSICDILSYIHEDFDVRYFNVSEVNESNVNEIKTFIKISDLVFTQPIFSHRFDFLKTSNLQSFGKKVYIFPNIYTNLLHPDICYIGSYEDRIQSPMGDYHSIIICKGFLEGKSINFVKDAFKYETFKSFNYFSSLYEATAGIIERNEEFYPEISILIDQVCKISGGHFMYTLNHPTIDVLILVACDLMKRSKLKFNNGTLESIKDHVVDHLYNNSYWPVYPEIGQKLHIPGDYNYRFGNNDLSLDEFIKGSYESYSKIDLERIIPNGEFAKEVIYNKKFV